MSRWLDNRPRSLRTKFLAWRGNPVGGLIRLVEILYLGAPLTSILRAGRESTIEYIQHLPGVLEHLPTSEQEIVTKSIEFVPNEPKYSFVLLNEVKIHVDTAIVGLNSGHFFTNRLEFQDFMSGYHYSSLRKLQHSKPVKVEVKCIPLARQNYYYHFLLEDLPAILLSIESNPQATILTPPNQPKYVLEALSRTQCPVLVCEEEIALVKELIIPNRVKGSEYKDFLSVSELFLRVDCERSMSRKLLLIRGKRPRGNVKIELNLMEKLISKGFEALDPENFTVSEQAEHFANASHIVSLHGGGLTNLIFAPRGAKVFEIHSHSWRNYAFSTLAAICDQQYTGGDENSYEKRLQDWLMEND